MRLATSTGGVSLTWWDGRDLHSRRNSSRRSTSGVNSSMPFSNTAPGLKSTNRRPPTHVLQVIGNFRVYTPAPSSKIRIGVRQPLTGVGQRLTGMSRAMKLMPANTQGPRHAIRRAVYPAICGNKATDGKNKQNARHTTKHERKTRRIDMHTRRYDIFPVATSAGNMGCD